MEPVSMTYDEVYLKCTTCKLHKPSGAFTPSPNKARGFQYTCKACRRSLRKSAYTCPDSDTKDYRKFKHLHQTYGISRQEYMKLLESQDSRCKICGLKETDIYNSKLHVDHSHTTGKIRGLLCRACNHGVGNFNDSTELLAKAITYLENIYD